MIALTPDLPVTVLATAQPNLWQAFLMGMIQGLTEFLPISSTAHLRILPALLGWPDFGVSFSAVIQLGSVVAVLIYFARDLRQVATGTVASVRERKWNTPEFKTFVGVMLGTLPIVVIGGGIKYFYGSPPRQLTVIGVALIVVGILMAVGDRLGKRERAIHQIQIADGLLVGLAQALAIIPGVSRSGSTITTGLFLGMKREMAARFAFLLGIPALTLAGLVEFVSDYSSEGIPAQLVGTASALLFSYLSIDWLLKFLQKRSTDVFVAYRIFMGVFLILSAFTGLIQ